MAARATSVRGMSCWTARIRRHRRGDEASRCPDVAAPLRAEVARRRCRSARPPRGGYQTQPGRAPRAPRRAPQHVPRGHGGGDGSPATGSTAGAERDRPPLSPDDLAFRSLSAALASPRHQPSLPPAPAVRRAAGSRRTRASQALRTRARRPVPPMRRAHARTKGCRATCLPGARVVVLMQPLDSGRQGHGETMRSAHRMGMCFARVGAGAHGAPGGRRRACPGRCDALHSCQCHSCQCHSCQCPADGARTRPGAPGPGRALPHPAPHAGWLRAWPRRAAAGASARAAPRPSVGRMATLAYHRAACTMIQGPPTGSRRETSPYLLQHAHNPVDWYPWGEEAFARAARERPPIFLSDRLLRLPLVPRHGARVVRGRGRSPAFLNEHFVAIKVDREERPDVDDVYMTAVQATDRAAAAGR